MYITKELTIIPESGKSVGILKLSEAIVRTDDDEVNGIRLNIEDTDVTLDFTFDEFHELVRLFLDYVQECEKRA